MAGLIARAVGRFRGLDPRVQAVAVALAAGIAGIVAAVAVLLAVLLPLTLLGVDVSPLAYIAISLVLVQGVSFGGVASIYLVRWRDRSPLSLFRVPSLRDLGVTAVGFVGAFALLYGLSFLVQSVGAPTAENATAQLGAENPEVLLLLIPAAFVFIGPGEEILFRGVVQNRLREAFSPWVAIPLASLIFGAIHYVALSGAPSARLVTVGILSVLTLVFGATYEYTDNLAVPALIHGGYDALLFAALYVVVVYGPGLDAAGGNAVVGFTRAVGALVGLG